mmetsp:Transcript_14396/g.25933  ORF Transcript_14396/g.25933 Transcript_14396/m.25933 type:complete len:265 (+) Transcript_14396:171-965(+)
MATNCSAPLSFIHRATTSWAQRSRLPLKRHILSSHQNTTKRSYHLAVSAVPAPIDPRSIIDRNNNNSILQPQNVHAATSHTAVGRVRTMVMVTQTSASDKDNEKTPNNTIIEPTNDTTEAPNAEGGLAVTASCYSRIKQLASTRPNPDTIYLRLYVDAGGCSGFQYKFLLLSEDNSDNGNSLDADGEEEDGTIDPEEDIIFEQDGTRMVVDQTSLELLRGSTIDYVQEMIRSSFAVVNNPQSESACGCGSSFAVKNFESNPAMD